MKVRAAGWKYAVTDQKVHWIPSGKVTAVCGQVAPTGARVEQPRDSERCAECVNVLAGPAEGIEAPW